MGGCGSKDEPAAPDMAPPKQTMWLLPMKDLLAIRGPPPGHQELLALDKLVQWESDMLVIFASHQWVGFKHPDPCGEQLEQLREALKQMIAGEMEVSYEMETEIICKESYTMPREYMAKLQDAYIWYDYWSIPQVSLAPLGQEEATAKELWASVMSIPEYISRCQLFFALCPEVEHQDTGLTCSFNTWLQRGWCRLEHLCSALRSVPARVPQTLLVSSSTKVAMKNSRHWLTSPVGEGSFTVDSDKELLRPVVQSLMDTYTAAMAKSPGPLSTVRRRAVLAFSRTLMSGLVPEAPEEASLEEELVPFLEKYNFSTPLDRGEAGLGPLHCAALEGRPRLLEAMVAAGADVDATIATSLIDLCIMESTTPFMLCCIHGRLEAAKSLMRMRADIERQDSQGVPSIHLVALGATMFQESSEHTQLLKLLLDSGLSLDVPGPLGLPLLSAGCGWGTSCGALRLLLERKAAVDWCTAFGGPLHLVALWGYSGKETVELLVQHRADVDAALQPTGSLENLLLTAVQYMPSSSRASELWSLLPELKGATPLHVAAHRGHREVCQALLGHKADVRRRNGGGRSAFDLTARGGQDYVVDLLQRWSF